MYEFVDKSEWKPVKVMVENEMFPIAREYLWDNAGIRFDHNIIGSGKRALIMREVNGNRGFDLDYDLVIKKSVAAEFNGLKLKELFRNAFNYGVRDMEFDAPRNSTSVLTIPSYRVESIIGRHGDNQNIHCVPIALDPWNNFSQHYSKIIQYSCDLAIVYDSDEGRNCLHIDKHCLHNRPYFKLRPNSKDLKKKEMYIRGCPQGSNMIRSVYGERKNDHRFQDKASFQIYTETVHDLYNHFKQLEKNASKSKKKR